MKVTDVSFRRYDIAFREYFRTSQQTFASREGIIVRVESDSGTVGWGEIAPLDGFSNESLSDVIPLLKKSRDYLMQSKAPSDSAGLPAWTDTLEKQFSAPPSLMFGLESAVASLAAETAHCSLAQWLNPNAAPEVRLNATLSGNWPQVKRQLEQKLADGYTTFKIKVGVDRQENELTMLTEIRKIVGREVKLRLDANQAWDFDEACRFLKSAARFDIEYVEEPLMPEQLDRLAELRAKCLVPVALDESIGRIGLPALLDLLEIVDVAIIKPSFVGGIVRSSRLSLELARRGIRTVISSLLESGVGITCCLHLAASLKGQTLPCGLDTLRLFSDPLTSVPFRICNGVAHLPTKPGLGVTVGQWDSLIPVED